MSANNIRSSLFKIDDADPRLAYSANWLTGGVAQEWGSTTHGTRTKGANVTFVFNGTFVEAYGTVDSTGTKISYTLDSETNTATLPPVERPQYMQLLFQNTNLAPGEHTLVITCAEDGSTLWLDYLDFFGQLGPPVPPFSSLATSDSSASPSTSVPSGYIALAVIGGVLCLVGGILIGIYFFRRHRHRVKQSTNTGFDILPDHHKNKLYSTETLRMKDLGEVTMAPQSSALFTSVILSLGAPSSTSGAASRV